MEDPREAVRRRQSGAMRGRRLTGRFGLLAALPMIFGFGFFGSDPSWKIALIAWASCALAGFLILGTLSDGRDDGGFLDRIGHNKLRDGRRR